MVTVLSELSITKYRISLGIFKFFIQGGLLTTVVISKAPLYK